MTYDVAVVGGGPAGYAAALEGARLGGKVILFEANRVGGTCLNVGCIPTKCIVSQAQLMERIRLETQKGIFRDAGQFSYKKICEEKERVVAKLTGGVSALLKSAGVTVVQAEAHFVDAHTLRAGGQEYKTKKALIATGSKNLVMPLPGIDGVNVVDSTGALALSKLPRSIVIVGAGVIGLEFASAFSALGSEVTAVDVLPALLPGEDREAADALQKQMEARGVHFLLGSKVLAITDENGQKCVTIEQNSRRQNLHGEFVLVAVGRVPAGDAAKELGLRTDKKGFIAVDAQMKTSIEDVYAAGDVIGGYLLAHSAYAEAEAAMSNCLGGHVQVRLDVMPRCVFTIPGLSAVGQTIAKEGDEGFVFGKFPFSASGKAMADGSEEGFVKWAARRDTGELLGCTILGPESAELLSAATVAVNCKVTVEDFERIIFAHPTLSESVKEAALDCAGKALHMPAKRRG